MPDRFDETDAVLARKLAEIAPPADLRSRLLAQAASEKPEIVEADCRPWAWWAGGITAVAAAIALAFIFLGTWTHRGEPIMAATADLSAFLSGKFSLTMETSDVGKVRKWLAADNPNRKIDLPAALAGRSPVGCRELDWRDHHGSLACFSMGDGKLAHLAMFPTKIFVDAPGATPVIAEAGDWTRAAWSRDGTTYLLFVPAGADPMKELIGLVGQSPIGLIASSNPWSSAWPAGNFGSLPSRMTSRV